MDRQHVRIPLLIIGLAMLAFAISIMMSQTIKREVPSVETPVQAQAGTTLTLSSPAFKNNGIIPVDYTCQGKNISPPLTIESPPANVTSYVLVVHDPDAPTKDWSHWLIWNIPADVTTIVENTVPVGATVGTTDFNATTYGGPCPPKGTGTHRYTFDLYALTEFLPLGPQANRGELIAAINGKTIARARLVGTVTAAE